MKDIVKNIDTKSIIMKIIEWGIGAILMIAGCLVMIFHKKLDIEYPTFLIIGAMLLSIGAIIYIIMLFIEFKLKILKIETNYHEVKKSLKGEK